jgi:hypothetical protein
MSNQLKAALLQEGFADQKRHVAAVLHPLEGREGFAFAMVCVSGRYANAQRVSDPVLEHVGRLAGTFGAGANVQHRFEQFLSALNETIATQIASQEGNVPIAQFNAVVGIACQDQLFLSGTGELFAIFLHRTPERRYQVFDLFRSIQTAQALPTWEKVFAVVLDGDLHPGDVFCLSSRDIPRFVAKEEMNAILSTLPPKGAAAKIRQYFPANTEVSAMILQSEDPAASGVEIAQPLASVSLNHFAKTTEETGLLLDDQTPRPISGILKAAQKLRSTAPKHRAILRSLWRLGFSSISVATHILANAVTWTARLAVALAKRETRSRMVATTKTGTKQTIQSATDRIRRLPKSTKTLSIAAIGIVLILVGSVSIFQHAQTRSAEAAAYQKQVVKVEDMMEKASGAVIYKDETQARKLYAEALSLAQTLPTDTNERANTAAKMKNSINGAFDELRHLVNIPQPALLGELDSANGLTGRALVASGGGIYAFGSDKRVYLLDAASRSLSPVETSDGEVGIATSASSDDGMVLFLDDRPGVSRLDLDNKLLRVTNVLPPSGSRWTDLALYGGKLYVLEPTSGQIVKYNPAGSDFDGGTKWIRAKTADLSDAVSLAIDATVFVLKPNGQIVRFVGGSEVGWNQTPADPAVGTATDIWTSAESKYVYVLDPSTQRLIVYEKENGSLVTQYRSDAFQGLTDFLVDETDKTIYLLAGPKLYSITASHLK